MFGMEEQLTPLLRESIHAPINTKIDFLEKYYKLFDEKNYVGSNFELIYKDMQEVYSLSLQSLRYGFENTEEQESYKKLIQAIIQTKEYKNKIKLIPLIVYLNSNRVFYDYLYTIDFFKNFREIKEYFIGTVTDSGVNIDLKNIPQYHWENEAYNKYEVGIKNLEFKKIYSFVESVERGIGYRNDIFFDFLVFISYKLFFDDFLELINNKKDTFEVIHLIDILSVDEILYSADKSTNILLKFEAIRKAVYFKNNNHSCSNLLKDEQELLCNIILEFSNQEKFWQQFLDYYLVYPSRNPQLFKSMAKAIEKMDNDNIDILVQKIKIDKYINDDSRFGLNSCFLTIENDDLQKSILEKLFARWERFIDENDEYFGSIILTDILDLLIVYIREFINKEKLISKIKATLLNLAEIDNKWFKNSSEQSNYLYKEMSKLFVYGFALDKYKLVELKREISFFCNHNLVLQRESKQDKKTSLQLFNEYILSDRINYD